MDLFSRIDKSADDIGKDADFGEKSVDLNSLLSGSSIYSGAIPPDRKTADLLRSSVGWVYACAGVIADEIANIKIRLYKQTGGDIEEVEDHPALDILHRANDFTTKFDHFWMTAQYLELTGEAPWFVSFKGNIPNKLLLIRPDNLTIKAGNAESVIGGYTYRVGSREVPLEAKEVVFIRYPNPDRLFRGMGPLQAAARTVDLEDFSEEYNRRFFYNSARPDGVLSTEQKLGRDQLTTLERKLSQKYKGIGNSHKTLILEKGLKWEPMALTQKDMDFIGQANFSRDKILGIFRVPRTVIGITDDVNRANAEATDYVFIRRTIKPKMERIIQQLNEFLLPLFPGTEGMFYDFDNPVPEDRVYQLEYNKAALMNGWLSINEVRAMDGYEPVEGGDELRVPISNTPLGADVLDPMLRSVVKRVDDKTDRLASMKARGRVQEREKKLKKALEERLTQEIAGKMRNGKKKKLAKRDGEAELEPETAETQPIQNEEKAMAFQTKQLNIADEYQKTYELAINRVLKAQRNSVISRMGGKSVKEEIDWKQFLLVPDQEKRRIATELSSIISNLIIAQAAEAFAHIGSDEVFDKDNPAIKRFLDTRAFRFARPMTLLTNRSLARQFKEGVLAGESIPELQKRVEKVFGAMEKYRSERIARTETIKTTNYSTLEAWKESDVVTAQQWLTALDERTCEWCGPMNGRIIGLDEPWFKKGDKFQGVRGGVIKLDYERIEMPPLHTNCRCTLNSIVLDGKSVRSESEKSLDEILQTLHDDENKTG